MSFPRSNNVPIGGVRDNSLLRVLSQVQFHDPQGFEGVHNLLEVIECVEVPSAQRKTIATTSAFMHIATIASRLSFEEAALRQKESIPLKSSGLDEGEDSAAVATDATSLLTECVDDWVEYWDGGVAASGAELSLDEVRNFIIDSSFVTDSFCFFGLSLFFGSAEAVVAPLLESNDDTSTEIFPSKSFICFKSLSSFPSSRFPLRFSIPLL